MAKRGPSDINLLLAVDKTVGITSHDVVARVRRVLNERRVGHAGTLDPLASGVMVVGVGQATRLLGRITLGRKSYLARVAFGFETNTDDAEGEPTRHAACPPELADPAFATHVLAGFLGPQEQVPPAFSAISVNGVRSYRRARAGEEVELPARRIEVFAADLISVDEGTDAEDGPVWTVSFEVSKGTYIRALARDIGRAAGSAAHVAALRRTASGSISLGRCVEPDALTPELARERCLDPVAVLGLPAYDLSERALTDVRNGRSLPPSAVRPHAATAVRDATGASAADRARARARAAARPQGATPAPSPSPLSAQPEGAPVALVAGGELVAIAAADGGRLRMQDVFPQGIGGVL